MRRDDFAVLADDDHVRDAADTVALFSVLIRVVGNGDVEVLERAGDVAEDFALLDVDGDDLEPVLGEGLQLFQHGQLALARTAPRGPEGDDQHLAGELRGFDFVAVAGDAEARWRGVAFLQLARELVRGVGAGGGKRAEQYRKGYEECDESFDAHVRLPGALWMLAFSML